ncbi:MAG: inositol monophosphatase, partial [Verrucomicrobia bacterium]|nr:inositol monophosphatase [Verrucomicrobiota bacterium]
MNPTELGKALITATAAARGAGALMRKNLNRAKNINSTTQHDIKLELDVRCQKLIERALRRDWPDIAVLGEEGVLGDTNAARRWVVDPIDGTVNFTYGIPHACVSIALQERASGASAAPARSVYPDGYDTVLGVVYDPFSDELFTAIRGHAARRNGGKISVSPRVRLDEAIVSIGFAKDRATLNRGLPFFNRVSPRVRKIRMMGAA